MRFGRCWPRHTICQLSPIDLYTLTKTLTRQLPIAIIPFFQDSASLRIGSAQLVLLAVGVEVCFGMPLSSSGLGYQVLILETGVRVPLGVITESPAFAGLFLCPGRVARNLAQNHSACEITTVEDPSTLQHRAANYDASRANMCRSSR